MKIQELLNPRVSYQVLITFDLIDAESSKYEQLRETLAQELDLEKQVRFSQDDGGVAKSLPHNTLAALWTKDATEQETRDHFAEAIRDAFKKHQLHGRYVILVAQNWAVAAGKL